jgi:MoxR-like ATPase
MSQQIFHIQKEVEFRKAGAMDLIEVQPAPGGNTLYIQKCTLEVIVFGIVSHEFIHLSGPTGSAKSSLLEAITRCPENFAPICRGLEFAVKPIRLYPIEMATYETPGELFMRRSLKDGATYDEESKLVQSLRDALACREECYPVIWLREMGRVHSASVQGGLLNLMTKGDILLPGGSIVSGQDISWVADSNYQAEQDSTHTLVTLDDALKRRFSINVTLDYLSAELEVLVLQHLMGKEFRPKHDADLLHKIVELGQEIRNARSQGALHSVAPPTIYGYLSFVRMAKAMPHLNNAQIALCTLLGNAPKEDQKMISGILTKVFSIQMAMDEQNPIAANFI